MAAKPNRSGSILLCRTDRFGEFLLTTPAMAALKVKFPDSHGILLVAPALRELAEELPFVDEIIEWQPGRHSLRQLWRLGRRLRSAQVRVAVVFNPLKELHLVTFLAGVPLRLGYDRKWGFLLTHRLKDTKAEGNRHEVECNLELAGLLGATAPQPLFSLRGADEESSQLLRRFQLDASSRLVVVHPWTSDPHKQWPLERFVELSRRLAIGKGVQVAIIGGRDEQVLAQQWYASSCGPTLRQLTGQTSFRELTALLKRATLLVSGDSGPVHLASCVGLPVLALFRSDIPGKGPRRWGPLSAGSNVLAKDNLLAMSVDEVMAAAERMLG